MEDRKVKYEKISSWFGLVTEVKGSPYHDIDYRRDIFIVVEYVWVATPISRMGMVRCM